MKGPGLVTSSGTSFALLDFLAAVASAHTHDSDDGEPGEEPAPKKHKPSSSSCAGLDATWREQCAQSTCSHWALPLSLHPPAP
eukprot:5497067-Amphidinium_carterae.7